MFKTTLVVIALLFPVDTLTAAEAQMEMDSAARFQRMDKDHNGYISHDEAKDQHRVFWYYPRADKNSDGALDQSEFSAFEREVPDFQSTPAK